MKRKIGIIGGYGLREFNHDNVIFVNRHTYKVPTGSRKLPHKIGYEEIIRDLMSKNAACVIGVGSVGSLDIEIKPGTIVIPDDFICFHPCTIYNNDTIPTEIQAHTMPSFDEKIRDIIIKSTEVLEQKLLPINKYGVYWNTGGPRLETRAEITHIANSADIVGMNIGKEVTIACELGVPYASVCMVDNYANGIIDEELSEEVLKQNAKTNKAHLERTLNLIIGGLNENWG